MGQPFPTEVRYHPASKGPRRMAMAECCKCFRREWKIVEHGPKAERVFRRAGWLTGGNRKRDVCPGCRQQKPHRDLTPAQRRAAYVRIETEAGAIAPRQEHAAPLPDTALAVALVEAARQLAAPTDARYTHPSNCARGAKRFLGNPHARPGVDFNIAQDAEGLWRFEIIEREKDMSEGVGGKAIAAPPVVARAAPPPKPTQADNRRIIEALDEHYKADEGLYRESFTDDALAQKLNVPRA